MDGQFALVLHNDVVGLKRVKDSVMVKHPRTKITLPMFAAMMGRPDCLKYICVFMSEDDMRRIPKGNHWTILMHACASGEDVHASNEQEVKLECVKVLLEKLPSATFVNMTAVESEDTALHLASRCGYDAIVRMLLRQPGIKAAQKNKLCQTPYDVASTPEVRRAFDDTALGGRPPVKARRPVTHVAEEVACAFWNRTGVSGGVGFCLVSRCVGANDLDVFVG
jgi:hypothetical protein